MNSLAEQKQTQRHGTQTCDYQMEKVLERINRELGINRYTLLYSKCINSEDLLCSSGNYIQCLV